MSITANTEEGLKPHSAKPKSINSPLLASLLAKRGFTDESAIDEFLNPDYEKDTHDPFLLKDVDVAASRIIRAMDSGEKIAIYSDYDADGIPGAVILHDFFKKVGFKNFENYIPDRNEEGFGVNVPAVESLASRGVKLIITIDCGITDILPIARAKELGVDTIVTDHHEPGAELPPAIAIVNPKQKDCAYPFKFLCGAGVVYKLVQAIIKKKGEDKYDFSVGWEKWLLDMVGLATLSDMVPLTGENRVFATYGLKVLQKSPRVGLMKLLRTARVNQRFMGEDDVSFTITPRINAASRMGVPYDAFELLSTTDEVRAGVLISHLNKINDQRKGLVAAITKEVRQRMVELENEGRVRDVIVMGHIHWKPTVLGLVANSLKDDHGRPVFLWGKENGSSIKGSCRSDGRVSVVDLMEHSREHFVTFGGHKMSGGFVVEPDKIHVLENALCDSYKKLSVLEQNDFVDDHDGFMNIDDVNNSTFNILEKMAPYGVGNPKPVFLFKNIEVAGVKPFGKTGNHIELSFENSVGEKFSAISFFVKANDPIASVKVGDKINLKASIEKSFFKRYPELRLRVVSIS